MSNKKLNVAANGWVHLFAITDIKTAAEGYTVYKITSILFPRGRKEALTCISIWKRFHDIKKLHRNLNKKMKQLQLAGELPSPDAVDCNYFKRFNPDIIEQRKEYILQLLDFVALHPALYKSYAFLQFFKECKNVKRRDSEVIAKSEAVACPSLQIISNNAEKIEQNNTFETQDNHDAQIKQQSNSINAVDEPKADILPDTADKLPTKFNSMLTPMASIESNDEFEIDYIYLSAIEFSRAVEAEAAEDYEKAYHMYTHGVDLLSSGCRDDGNAQRRCIAESKIAKYSARAAHIFKEFLDVEQATPCAESKSKFHLTLDTEVDSLLNNETIVCLERSWQQLEEFKVERLLNNKVMQVRAVYEAQNPLYVLKGIEKPPSHAPAQSIFLPQNVPYMSKLRGYFQSEQKLFLLLQHAPGGRLYNYITSYSAQHSKASDLASLFPAHKEKIVTNTQSSPAKATASDENNFVSLVQHSQQLLSSVSKTLKDSKQLNSETEVEAKKTDTDHATEFATNQDSYAQHQVPEVSIRQWTAQLVLAIQNLHEKGIILGDLHMDNLLLGDKGQLMLSYFYQNEGFIADNPMYKTYSFKAINGHFIAPESTMSFKSDWWSLGVVLYQLLLSTPFKTLHPGPLNIYGCIQFADSAELSENAKDLLHGLLQQNPEERLDYEKIKTHSFFEGLDWNNLRKMG